MEENKKPNRYWSKIIWHTMDELIPFYQEIILRNKDGSMSIGEAVYREYGEGIKWYSNSSMTDFVDSYIVAWGEFEFPTDWDYNK